jgi:glycosyltransferase involved in cell wall biosynthesis
MPDGVSIAICCHNSAQRLPPTLAHLAAQEVPSGLPWEVIVVDNASEDDTAGVAVSSWPSGGPVPFRVVAEPQAGLSYARRRAFAESRYRIISFIDDDNWLCPKWVAGVAEIMASHPRAGACGGFGIAAYEVEPPDWFVQYQGCFAIGAQADGPGVICREKHLWGAGVSIRKCAWQQLLDGGFSHLLVGRKGRQLSGGEDLELSYALTLSGWDLYYDPSLNYQHYIPAKRMSWDYLRRLNRNIGAAMVGLEPYDLALKGTLWKYRGRLLQMWAKQTYWDIKAFSNEYAALLSSRGCGGEGDPRTVRAEYRLGRIVELLRGPGVHSQRFRTVLDARWARASASPDCLAAA